MTDERNEQADETYMRRAIALARTAAGWTNPNPLVGAVIVKDGRIIGEGCHERFGDLHAERNALKACTEDPAGATVYVTLEPCSHTGHQPPCADALIEAGVARVVVGSRDPNLLVSGRGNDRLRAAGIAVQTDFLRGECDKLNPIFFHYITTKTPYVVAKWAMCADGKIATQTNDSKWVTGELARADVHDIRHRLAAICVGLGTVSADDPMLTARRETASNNPVRVVCDSHLRLSKSSNLVRTARDVRTIVACAGPVCASFGCAGAGGASNFASAEEINARAAELRAEGVPLLASTQDGSVAVTDHAITVDGTCTGEADFLKKARELEELGLEIVRVPGPDGQVDLGALMEELGAREIDSLLVEGGGTLLANFFENGLVNEAVVYVAPKVAGGEHAKTPVMGAGVARMADAWPLGAPRVETFGHDIKITYVNDPERGYACSPAL